ncbi:hypothetical protein GF337_19890, partial [candidate division KSB1 bacterium]|nr:hypothetical protein [candidate division KSB1 bacterium]
MKILRSFIIILFLLQMNAYAGQIKVSATPHSSISQKGEHITIAVDIDISALPEKLGSFTAQMRWDVHMLKYVNYSLGNAHGFQAPVVNADHSADGELTFAAANPKGATGKVNVLNIIFEVNNTEVADCGMNLEFTAMAAAYTFTDLLPFIKNVTTNVELKTKYIPDNASLAQNYPNPFNPTTEITFELPEAELVRLSVYNLLGRKIKMLVNESKESGLHRVYWDGKDEQGTDQPAGIY